MAVYISEDSTTCNNLFENSNGRPMQFYIQPFLRERRFVRRAIEEYGGEILDTRPESETNYFYLVSEQEPMVWNNVLCYKSTFISDCIEAKKLLDIETYRLNITAMECCPRSLESKKDTSRNDRFNKIYTSEEDRIMIQYIIQNDEYRGIKGTEMWKRMGRSQLLGHRTWQSLKERFLKRVLPNICTFPNVSRDEVENFLLYSPQSVVNAVKRQVCKKRLTHKRLPVFSSSADRNNKDSTVVENEVSNQESPQHVRNVEFTNLPPSHQKTQMQVNGNGKRQIISESVQTLPYAVQTDDESTTDSIDINLVQAEPTKIRDNDNCERRAKIMKVAHDNEVQSFEKDVSESIEDKSNRSPEIVLFEDEDFLPSFEREDLELMEDELFYRPKENDSIECTLEVMPDVYRMRFEREDSALMSDELFDRPTEILKFDSSKDYSSKVVKDTENSVINLKNDEKIDSQISLDHFNKSPDALSLYWDDNHLCKLSVADKWAQECRNEVKLEDGESLSPLPDAPPPFRPLCKFISTCSSNPKQQKAKQDDTAVVFQPSPDESTEKTAHATDYKSKGNNAATDDAESSRTETSTSDKDSNQSKTDANGNESDRSNAGARVSESNKVEATVENDSPVSTQPKETQTEPWFFDFIDADNLFPSESYNELTDPQPVSANPEALSPSLTSCSEDSASPSVEDSAVPAPSHSARSHFLQCMFHNSLLRAMNSFLVSCDESDAESLLVPAADITKLLNDVRVMRACLYRNRNLENQNGAQYPLKERIQ